MPKSMVLGTGRATPERVLTNADLEKIVDTTDEWIRERTGIERRYMASPEDRNSKIAARACQQALSAAKISAEQIDLIVMATVTGDVIFPSTACYVQELIGARNAAAFDVAAACSGFIYGLSLADSLIANGKAKYALVIGSELLSRITDWTDRSTCVLFGDGSGAVVLGPANGARGVIDTYLKSDGRLTHLLCVPGGGTNMPLEIAIAERKNFLYMEGREVFKYAVTAMVDASDYIIKQNGLTGADIDVFVPHQANLRIISATAKRLNVPMQKVYLNLQNYGNTSAASIPIAIDEAMEKGVIKAGDLCLMVAFGGGFTWGSALVRF